MIERMTGAHIRREEVPSAAAVEDRESRFLEERLTQALLEGKWGRYRGVVEGLLEDHDAVEVAAAALSLAAARTVRKHPAPHPEQQAAPAQHREPRGGEEARRFRGPGQARPPRRPKKVRGHRARGVPPAEPSTRTNPCSRRLQPARTARRGRAG